MNSCSLITADYFSIHFDVTKHHYDTRDVVSSNGDVDWKYWVGEERGGVAVGGVYLLGGRDGLHT